MNPMNWNAQSAKTVCVKFTKPLQPSLKALASIPQTTKDKLWNYARFAMSASHLKIMMYAKNALISQYKSKSITKTSRIRHALLTCTYANVLGASGTLRARAPKGSPRVVKRLTRGVALAIGISLFSPMAQISQAQIVPTKSVLKSYTKTLLTGKEYGCLSKLWGKESAWNHLADNPHSTAFGIPQMLNMTTTDPWKQINLGLKYIKHRYDTPCNAWKNWQSNGGWY